MIMRAPDDIGQPTRRENRAAFEPAQNVPSLRQLQDTGAHRAGQGRVSGERSERSLEAPGVLPQNEDRSDAI